MENIWSVKVGHNATGETKGFAKIPDEKKHDQRVVTLLTKSQLKVVDSYCNINKINRNELFRMALVAYFESQNFAINPDNPEDDPRQIKMF